MPATICPNCHRRREIAEYLARLPLLCSACHRLVIVETDDGTILNLYEAAASANGTPNQTETKPETPSPEESQPRVVEIPPQPVTTESSEPGDERPFLSESSDTGESITERVESIEFSPLSSADADENPPENPQTEPLEENEIETISAHVPMIQRPVQDSEASIFDTSEDSKADQLIPDQAAEPEDDQESIPELHVSKSTEPESEKPKLEISITPDPELKPLVVLEKASFSEMELPPICSKGSSFQSGMENSEKSKFIERLKEISSLSQERPQQEFTKTSAPAEEPSVEQVVQPSKLYPATIGQRFIARLIMGGLSTLAMVACVGWSLTMSRLGIISNSTPPIINAIVFFLPAALFVLLNTVLLGTRGQDLGKIIARIRIVGDDGAPVGYYRAFILREVGLILLPIGVFLVGYILSTFLGQPFVILPFVLLAMLLIIMDHVMIFTEPNRCLHDHLAKTRVVMIDTE